MKENTLFDYFAGRTTFEEDKNILNQIQKSEAYQKEFNRAKEDWNYTDNKTISLSTWNSWKKLEQNLDNRISFSKKKYYSSIAVAISIFLIFSFTIISLNHTSNGERFTFTSKSGQLAQVYLPDSTNVYLNSASSIVYKSSLWGYKRTVLLKGEAFFDVKRKGFGSFDVIANNTKVHVTGTRFNIQAYPDQKTSVVLEEGTVELSHPNLGTDIIMLPGDLVSVNNESKSLYRNKVNTKDFTSWKDGVLFFENNKLPDFLKVIERRFGVEFAEIDDPILNNLTITITLRNEGVEKVMQLLSAALPLKFETINQKIYITLDKKKYEKLK